MMCFVPVVLLQKQVLLREDRERGSGRSLFDGFAYIDCLYDPCVSSGYL